MLRTKRGTAGVLGKALHLFASQGYEATSIEDLLTQTGLSRSHFVATYGSKHGLLLVALDHYIDTALERLLSDLDQGSARTALTRSFKALLDAPSGSNTCFLQNCATKLARTDHEAWSRLRLGLERLEMGFAKAIARGQAAGEFRNDRAAALLAKYLILMLNGLQILTRADSERSPVEEVLAMVFLAVE